MSDYFFRFVWGCHLTLTFALSYIVEWVFSWTRVLEWVLQLSLLVSSISDCNAYPLCVLCIYADICEVGVFFTSPALTNLFELIHWVQWVPMTFSTCTPVYNTVIWWPAYLLWACTTMRSLDYFGMIFSWIDDTCSTGLFSMCTANYKLGDMCCCFVSCWFWLPTELK